MIDILLVLLIVFMVITPIAPKGLPASAPPDAPPQAPSNDQALVLTIDQHSRYALNNVQLAAADLPTVLAGILRARPVAALFVKAHPTLEYQDVVPAIAVARVVGIDRVGLLTK